MKAPGGLAGRGSGGSSGSGRSEADVVELASLPSLGGLYARGAGRSVWSSLDRQRSVTPDDLPATRVLVRGVEADPTHLADYQHLLREHGGDVLPAGFVHVLAFPAAMALMVRPEFPLPLLGMVHTANRITQHRALRLGDALDVTVSARDLRPHRAGVTVDVVAQVAVGGKTAWEGVSTYLAKGTRLRGGGEAEDPGARREFTPPTPTGQWRLGGDVGRRYADVSGDRNPIHTSKVAAKVLGFPRTIAHGMYTAARALAAVGPARGEAYRWDVDFAKPVVLPATVAVRVAPADEPGGGFAYAAWHARKGTPYLTGAVTPL